MQITTDNQNKVILISLTMMFYQAVANTDLAVVSQLSLQKGSQWAGPLLTCLLFLGSGLGSLYNNYIGRFQYRFCMFFGCFGYILFITMGIIFMKLGFSSTTYSLIFVGGFIGGLIASVFYNSTYNYVNCLAQNDNQMIKYFGINIGIVQFCNLLGNLISVFLIKELGQIGFLGGLDLIIVLISLIFLLFPDPQPVKQSQLLLESSQNENSLSQKPSQNSVKQFSKDLYKLFFIFGITGIIVSFIYTQLSALIYETFADKMSEVELNQLTFVIFIFQGIGEIIGGLFVVFYSMKNTISTERVYMCLGIGFMLSVLVIYLGYVLANQLIMGVGAIVAGVTDCACMALALSIAGKWEKMGVTAYNLSQTLTICATGLLIAFCSIEVVIGWICLYFLLFCISIYKYRGIIGRY